MSQLLTTKFKVYCAFNYKWSFQHIENIDLKVKTNESQTREEFLNELKGCHGIICSPRSFKIDIEALNAAGN